MERDYFLQKTEDGNWATESRGMRDAEKRMERERYTGQQRGPFRNPNDYFQCQGSGSAEETYRSQRDSLIPLQEESGARERDAYLKKFLSALREMGDQTVQVRRR